MQSWTEWLQGHHLTLAPSEDSYRGEVLRLLFTPKWLALTLVLLVLVLAFAWLGSWQWSRASDHDTSAGR